MNASSLTEDPFRVILRLAAERVFTTSLNLADLLDADAAGVFFRLSDDLASFGQVRTDQHDAKVNHQNLLTAERAYVVARRKRSAGVTLQGELPLDINT